MDEKQSRLGGILVVLFLSESYRHGLSISNTEKQELVNLKTFWIDKETFQTDKSVMNFH